MNMVKSLRFNATRKFVFYGMMAFCFMFSQSGATQETIVIDIPNLPAGAKPLEMIRVPAGTFLMGAPAEKVESFDDEKDESPQHKVSITNPFYIGKYEITQAQWKAVMGDNPAKDFGEGNDYPVYFVSWNDCHSFIEKLNSLGQGRFRLPTEAEWEYACRAGITTVFFWGDDPISIKLIDEYAWTFGENEAKKCHVVGLKKTNLWGLSDVKGNVWEWCYDYYGKYVSADQIDPKGPSSGTHLVVR